MAAPGHHEEHRSKAGEREIVGAAKVFSLYIRDKKRSVVDARLPGFLLGRLDEIFGAVDPHGFACRSDALGDQSRAVAETAADIEHAHTFGMTVPGQRLFAVCGETADQQVFETAKLVEQDGVPRLDDDGIFSSHGTSFCAVRDRRQL